MLFKASECHSDSLPATEKKSRKNYASVISRVNLDVVTLILQTLYCGQITPFVLSLMSAFVLSLSLSLFSPFPLLWYIKV